MDGAAQPGRPGCALRRRVSRYHAGRLDRVDVDAREVDAREADETPPD